MTNYKLSYNQNLRWTDYRAQNPLVPYGMQVRLDIVFSSKSSTPCLHVHNMTTKTIADNDKSIVKMYTGMVGNGRIESELFSLLSYKSPREFQSTEFHYNEIVAFAFNPDARLLFVIDYATAVENIFFYKSQKYLWGFYVNISIEYPPLCLAIPLMNISVK